MIDSFWASMSEETANKVANFKKDVLNSIKNNVNSCIDQEINWTDHHLENARRMREEDERAAAEPPPATEPPPTPA
jgi:hypothetical protein